MTAPALILESTVAFLREHEPFSRMARGDLELLAARAHLTYFPAGSLIVERGAAAPPLYVIQRGHVGCGEAATGPVAVVLGPGECFPLAAAQGHAAAVGYAAVDDVFGLRLAVADAAELYARSAVFADFCTRELAALVHRGREAAQREFTTRAFDQHSLMRPVAALCRREPVHCGPHETLREALQRMGEASVGTIAIVDDDGRPLGIFTLTDLLHRVVLAGRPLESAVAEVMTPAPGTVDGGTTAEEALATMASTGYHQLVVTRGGRISGVVSERDLFALQRVSMQHIVEQVRTAANVEALRPVAEDIGTLADNLVAQGAAAEPLTRTVSALHDAMTRRLFELLAPRCDLHGIDWCWLSLGSEGRREQTIASDQDNALLFAAPAGDVDAARARLAAFGGAVNEALAGLGMPLCPGNIMAGNPSLCLSVGEWRERFAGWMREPAPEALLAANIYFDFRALGGATALAEDLRRWLAGIAAASGVFLRLLATNAAQVEPPLGVVRAFRLEEGSVPPGTIDLKASGTRIFVDAARALALSFGVIDTGTAARLRASGRRLGLGEREVAALVDGFQFLQLLRLRRQREGAGLAADHVNRIDPYALNDLDQRLLKESFRQARGLQKLLLQTLAP